jgi:calcineurin-like phosphoesterase family protein
MHRYEYDPEEVMFTADTHFGHSNIIRFCNRPYKDAYHMNEEMVANWNVVVGPYQTVFHLGDFAWKGKGSSTVPKLIDRLNGEIILIEGNHDSRITLSHFDKIHDIAEVKVGDQLIVMCHYAMKVWNHSFRGSWHLHGHSHGTLPPDWSRKICDIGVDSWGYKPVSYRQLQAEMVQHGREPTPK